MPSLFPVRILSVPGDWREAAQFLSAGGVSLERATALLLNKNEIVFEDAKTALDFVNLLGKLGGRAYLNVAGSMAGREGRPALIRSPDFPSKSAEPEPKLLPFAEILLADDDPFG